MRLFAHFENGISAEEACLDMQEHLRRKMSVAKPKSGRLRFGLPYSSFVRFLCATYAQFGKSTAVRWRSWTPPEAQMRTVSQIEAVCTLAQKGRFY